MNYKKYIADSLNESAEIKKLMSICDYKRIEEISDLIADSYRKNGKLIAFGNGGSAGDAQHLVAELMGWYEIKTRGPLEAIALTTNTSTITAIGNDAGYDQIFSRQMYALGKPGDVALGISTSGNSPNVVKAIEVAKELGLKTLALTGSKKSKLSELADYALLVPSTSTPRIQEAHIAIIHVLCGLIENKLSGK